jgi:UDP-GlcNAc3NAcA epimerase
MYIITVVGARPQFIKAAAFQRGIAKCNAFQIKHKLIHTGQHYDAHMSDHFFSFLGIDRPEWKLKPEGENVAVRLSEMTKSISEILSKEKPDVVLVYGDTDSTLAGALAANMLNIPIAHVEAGLRSFDRSMPEERNRVLTDFLSDWLFTPTLSSFEQLRKEVALNSFAPASRIVFSGDIMYDALHLFSKEIDETRFPVPIPEKFALLTLHRHFNTDDRARLFSILDAIGRWVALSGHVVFFPVHPRTRKQLDLNSISIPKGVFTLDPLGYFETQKLLRSSSLVFTDSGGLQKEAFFHSKPSVVLRPTTEWVEIPKLGASICADADGDKIIQAAESLSQALVPPNSGQFGKGNAHEIIINTLLNA